LIQHRHDPVLKLAVIGVRDEHVAYPVEPLHPQLRPCKGAGAARNVSAHTKRQRIKRYE